MSEAIVYSICGMCSAHCPIQAEVSDGRCQFLQGNLAAPGIKGSLCARGAAGLAQTADDQRPQFPLLRVGERGQGLWKRISWDEALDLAVAKLKAAQEQDPKSILFSCGEGPFGDLPHALANGLGTPNYYDSHSSCSVNVQHAALSLFGFGHHQLTYDYKNAKAIVLQTRNLLESIDVAEVNELMAGLERGGKLTVIDIRATVTSGKADRFLMVRPGSDYALNLAIIHVLLEQELYDKEYVKANMVGVRRVLAEFVKPYTPEFAAKETGVSAAEIVALARELAAAAPAVIWHPGWMTARYSDSFLTCRSAYLINALLGSIGAKGGLPLAASAKAVGRANLKRLADLFPAPEGPRVDAQAWPLPGPGLLHLAFQSMASGEPYPLKAYVAWQHDPLSAYPDPAALKQALAKLDFLLCVTPNWSETAWQADLILPLSSYLERESPLIQKNGLRPTLYRRARVLEPRFDTKAGWEIVVGLAARLGLDALALGSIENIWAYQLQGTDVKLSDFDDQGFVPLTEKPVYLMPKFRTESGKIEVTAPAWEAAGLTALAPYETKPTPPPGHFRLTVGRCGLHTAAHTINNPLLNEQMSENVLWLNQPLARRMGIADGETVEVASPAYKGQVKAKLSQFIHPEACFLVHGFGRSVPMETRSYKKGLADNALMHEGLAKYDPAGGGVALQEHFVAVRKVFVN